MIFLSILLWCGVGIIQIFMVEVALRAAGLGARLPFCVAFLRVSARVVWCCVTWWVWVGRECCGMQLPAFCRFWVTDCVFDLVVGVACLAGFCVWGVWRGLVLARGFLVWCYGVVLWFVMMAWFAVVVGLVLWFVGLVLGWLRWFCRFVVFAWVFRFAVGLV